MSDLKDSIEALRLELRKKHAEDILHITNLASEQNAYQAEVARALEDLLNTHARCSPLIEKLVVTVATRLGLGHSVTESQLGAIEFEGTRPDLMLGLEQIFHGQGDGKLRSYPPTNYPANATHLPPHRSDLKN